MSLLDLVFPKRCFTCKAFGDYLCPSCFAELSFDTTVICLVCGKDSIDGQTHPLCRKTYSIDGVFCAVTYKKIAKKLIYTFKYQPYVTDVQHLLGELLYEALIQKELFLQQISSSAMLVPIPLSSKKLKQRGYNQSLLLARELSKKLELPVLDMLVRHKETTPQFGLNRDERKANVKGSFGIKKGIRIDAYKTVLLIDDVLTTGSTLSEAAKVLKRNGIKNVWGITFARD